MNGNGSTPTGEGLVERIESGLRMLARYRLQNDEARQGLIELIKQLEATLEYQHWSKAKAEAERECALLERLINADVVKYYELTGLTPAVQGIGARTKTNLNYNDDDAWEWCQEHLQRALALDRVLFEKHARAVMDTAPLGFMSVQVETIGTIEQDLSEYLGTAEVAESADYADGFPA